MHTRCTPLSELSLRRFPLALICLLHHTMYVSSANVSKRGGQKLLSCRDTRGTTLTSSTSPPYDAGTSEPPQTDAFGFICRRQSCGSQSVWAITSTTNYLAP